MQPFVSILIPCFNADQLVAQAIESALAQTGVATEVIVVDDGSTDRSLDAIRGFDAQIRWEAGPNRGANAARNRLLELARGQWLQYLDADDYLRPGKIRGQVQFAAEHPDAEIICSPTVHEVCESGELIRREAKLPQQRDPWVMLALWQLPQTGGSLWRRSALERIGGWRIGQPCCQEHELYCRLLQSSARFAFFDECLAVYRDWDHSKRLTRRLRQEVRAQRLLILERAERFLWKTSELTAVRRQAINDVRHQIARAYWIANPSTALDIVRQIEESDASFRPSEDSLSPPTYRLAYRMLGFVGAQRIADSRRKIGSLFAERRLNG
jgi:glycosyltransferase involved in cell wall biosynthesis